MDKTRLPLILVVEDDEEHIELFQERCKQAHLMNPVVVVRDGFEAAAYLAGESPYQDRHTHPLPGIVILDLVLRRMGGFELLLWIRGRPQFNHIPVVVFTAHTDSLVMERVRKRGADGFLAKGADVSELIAFHESAFLQWALFPSRTSNASCSELGSAESSNQLPSGQHP